METKLFIATKAVIVHDGKVLILREAKSYKDGTNAERYDVPGGRLNAGEHFSTALEREILEETGLSVQIGRPIAVGEWRPVVRGEQWQVVGIFFLCTTPSANVTLSLDHDAYEWIDPSLHQNYSLIDNLVPVFKEYLKSRDRA